MRNTMNELYHYGIKGMRWGIRKERKNKDSSIKKKSKTGKSAASKILKVVGGIGVTAIGIYAMPKLQNRLADKLYALYAHQLAKDIIDFDNLGPEIVRNKP